MLELSEMSFRYNKKLVLDKISVKFEASHIYGLVGANGEGKSTLLKCLGNQLYPNEGKILFNGLEVINNYEYLEEVFLLDEDVYRGYLSVESLVNKYIKLKKSIFDYECFYNLLKKFKLDKKQRLNTLSKGNLRVVYLIIALSFKFKVIILDEFLDGIDLSNRKMIKNLLLDYIIVNDALIIISSHTTSDIVDLCDQILLLKDMKISKSIGVEDMQESYKCAQLLFNEPTQSKDDFIRMGLEVYQYREFESIRWITIPNTKKQLDIINDIDTIDTSFVNISLEEVIFNEFTKK